MCQAVKCNEVIGPELFIFTGIPARQNKIPLQHCPLIYHSEIVLLRGEMAWLIFYFVQYYSSVLFLFLFLFASITPL